ncbi:MAG TPA: alpha/beta hydrolase [Flavobacteriales bacterium]|nr:alpha/beta hydrolase [Flavobacteriales bacterium]QQS73440.1 MAG: alpha/beta hydrolase [Flavobacteriales bacterium]HQV39745.1 alpha/beta hydrolase [Flavobacteriales bacterium]HQW33190.1 alpha/beta hydrolase [Flavobacteriales bacterium]HQY02838.1 alpha/beta hydrolase [Flavobacteriales bacterium]
MRIHHILLGLGLSGILASCNVVKMSFRHDAKVFQKSGLRSYTFTDTAGPHYTWSSTAPGSADDGRPKLMLVHGITSQSLMWAKNVKDLSKDFDLIIPDLISHGHSTSEWSGNSVDAQVAHLQLILDSLGVQKPVDLVGNSYGGAIAANFAEQHPHRVKTLVIDDGPASDYTVAMADSVARSVGAKDIGDLFNPQNKVEQKRLLSLVLYKPVKAPGFVFRQINDMMKAKAPQTSALLHDLLNHEDQYAHKAYTWPMPVYVFWGEGDRLIPLSVGKGIAARNHLPADHLIIFPEAGHVANIEKPEEFEKELRRVLGE